MINRDIQYIDISFQENPVPWQCRPSSYNDSSRFSGFLSGCHFKAFSLYASRRRSAKPLRKLRFVGCPCCVTPKLLGESQEKRWSEKVDDKLVGGILTPMKNDGLKVSWDYDIPNIWKNNPHVPNHQAVKKKGGSISGHHPFGQSSPSVLKSNSLS